MSFHWYSLDKYQIADLENIIKTIADQNNIPLHDAVTIVIGQLDRIREGIIQGELN